MHAVQECSFLHINTYYQYVYTVYTVHTNALTYEEINLPSVGELSISYTLFFSVAFKSLCPGQFHVVVSVYNNDTFCCCFYD
jgi:hypothetical protein